VHPQIYFCLNFDSYYWELATPCHLSLAPAASCTGILLSIWLPAVAAAIWFPAVADFLLHFFFAFQYSVLFQVHISNPTLVLTVTVQKHEMKGVLEEDSDVCFVLFVIH